jgi:hypothetical protein
VLDVPELLPLPDVAPDELVPIEDWGEGEVHAASANAHAKGMIHLVIKGS